MKSEAEWDGYGSYESYINRGLDGLFNIAKVENVSNDGSNQPIKQIKSGRSIKPKDVYDIVASYSHHEDDKQWLVDMLLRLPLAKRESVMLRYGQVYNSAQSAVTKNNRQAGQARREANTWLLEYVEQ
jgi:hypothetical protein